MEGHQEDLRAVISDNSRLVAELTQKISDLEATVRTQNSTIKGLETELQEERAATASPSPSPSACLPRRRPRTESLGSAGSNGRPTSRQRIDAAPASPVRVAAASAAARIPLVGPAAARVIAGNDGAAQSAVSRPVVVELQPQVSGSSKKSSGSRHMSHPTMGKVVMQLAMTGKLKNGTPYDRTMPPPLLFPN